MNNADANLAALLLDRLDVSPDDDARVDQITEIVRGLAADRRNQAAEITRLSAALSVALAQLEEERARNAAARESALIDATNELTRRRRLLHSQFEVLDIQHADAMYEICIDAVRSLAAPPLAIIPGGAS